MGLKVAILGGKARQQYFRHPTSTEVWMINGQMAGRLSWAGQPHRAFNIHLHKNLVRYGYPFQPEAAYAKAHPETIFYTADRWPKGMLSNWQKFPRDKLAKQPHGDYHCGSFDWLVAYAAYLGANEISLHGIGLTLEAGEPISARACLEYWCGYAAGKGAKITLAPDCDIFSFYHLVKSKMVYGYDDTPVFEDRTKRGVSYSYKK